MVTFRISCLLTIPSEAGKLQYVFEIEEKGNSFMIACFTAGVCYKLGKIWKNNVILLKSVNFVVTNTKKSIKFGYYL